VVDDGRECQQKITKYASMRDRGDVAIWLPFDSGFGEKANVAMSYIYKNLPHIEYVLVASDDFEFNIETRYMNENMQKVLEANAAITVASGRVDGNPYEFCWEMSDGGKTIRELRKYYGSGEVDGVRFHLCDLTVNFSLIRVSTLRDLGIKWDGGDVKIGGGEH